MCSVSLALVVLWTQSPALALVLVGPLVAVALHQRATHNALRAMRLALTDPLTGLGNHRHFQEQLQIQLEEASAAREPLTVCLFDLDDFKQINDRYGHPAGDRVLAHVAGKLRGIGEAYRLGGDEFAVVFPRTRADAAAEAAEGVVRALGEEEWEQGGPLNVTAGIATYPDHSNDRNALVRVADIALYWAKGEGKNRVCVYRPDMPAVTQLRRLDPGAGQGGEAPGRRGARECRRRARRIRGQSLHPGRRSRRRDRRASAPARGGDRADPPRRPACTTSASSPSPRRSCASRARSRGARRTCSRAIRRSGTGCSLPLDIEPCRRGCCTTTSAGTARAVPSQLAGERIPLGARIIFAADAWDAMTNARPYSPAQSHDDAREELMRCSGKQFDPVVVAALLDEVSSPARALERPHLTVVA